MNRKEGTWNCTGTKATLDCYGYTYYHKKKLDDFPEIYAGNYATWSSLFFWTDFILSTKQVYKLGRMQVRIPLIDRIILEWPLCLVGKKRNSLYYAEKIRPELEKLSELMPKIIREIYYIEITENLIHLDFPSMMYNDYKRARELMSPEDEELIKEHLEKISDALIRKTNFSSERE
ncbi:MAG: hypothetical protein K6B46_04655 [Opitutales bacterium]|nr:hypothetical protein [Opitutales bacterium]